MNDNNNTDLNAADLSDVTLELKPDNINDICNTWEISVKEAGLESIDVRSIYKPLVDNGVGISYFECLHNSFEAVNNLMLSTINTIKQTSEEQVDISNQFTDNYDNQKNYGNYGGYGGSSYGSEDSGSNNTNIEVPVNNVPQDKVTINKDFVDKINKLDNNSYISFMTALSSISKDKLLDLIVDKSSASILKKSLLESPNLSDDLKEIISKLDENELQVTLQSILTDNVNLTDLSKEIIYNYTESLAQSTNLDILKVTKETQFFKNVDELFNKMNELSNKSNANEELLNIYDGSSDNENITDFVRVAIDTLAKKNNIDYENLLTNETYNTKIKDELRNLSKSLAYFKTINKFGTDAAELIYKTILS